VEKKSFDTDTIIDVFKEYKWLRYAAYAGGFVVSIWILGKGSKLIADAVVNFKLLKNAIKN
jgi:hypothetical protein